MGGDDRANHLFDHIVADALLGYLVRVLRGDDNGVHAHWLAKGVLDRDLGFAVGTQVRQRAGFANRC